MRIVRLFADLAAALCAGGFLARWRFSQAGHLWMPPHDVQVERLLPWASVAVIAVVAAVVVRPQRLGWALTVPAPVVVALNLPNSAGLWTAAAFDPALLWLMAATAGLALGGVALAVASAAPVGRVAIAGGLAAGFVAGPATATLPAPTLEGIRTGAIAIAVILTIAAVVALLDRRAVPAGTRSVGFVVVAVLGAALLVAAFELLEPRLSISDTPPAVKPYPWVGLALGIGMLFAWYAYRRGGAAAARWMVLALGLAAPLVLAGSRTDGGSRTLLIAVAALAAVAGMALGGWFGRFVPWDAIGVLAASVGWMTASPVMLQRYDGAETFGPLLMIGGTAFGLAAGAARLWRSNVDQLAAHTALGLALIVPASALLLVPTFVEDIRISGLYQQTPFPVPALGVLCAIAVGALSLRRLFPASPASTG